MFFFPIFSLKPSEAVLLLQDSLELLTPGGGGFGFPTEKSRDAEMTAEEDADAME